MGWGVIPNVFDAALSGGDGPFVSARVYVAGGPLSLAERFGACGRFWAF